MRKSIDGLCTIAEKQLKMDPESSSLFCSVGEGGTASKRFSMSRYPQGFVIRTFFSEAL